MTTIFTRLFGKTNAGSKKYHDYEMETYYGDESSEEGLAQSQNDGTGESFDENFSKSVRPKINAINNSYSEEEENETAAELAIEMYDDGTNIIIQAMVAGVRPEDLDVNIERSIVTIDGTRRQNREVAECDFHHQELYWGSFSRTISLPHEVEPQDAQAFESHGLLTIVIPKIDKGKKNKVKIHSSQ
jgi:HSP20 family protein